ncbi:erythromycin esterase family protein [Spongiimicrobium salis]|uniref:erythromycin esterase family protein n=1 Tax=Spongiimicrobium salis TaxID=1667022 RepID=UPI00374D5566
MHFPKLKKCFFLLLLPIGMYAQLPLNLDFEKQSVEGTKRPWGWYSPDWGHSFALDSTTVTKGTYSLHSSYSLNESPNYHQSFEYNLEPFELKGRDIRILGNVKGKRLKKSVYISLNYVLYDEITGTFEIKNLTSKEFSGTFDWKKIGLHLKLPKSTTKLSLKIRQIGLGEAWFDNFELLIDGQRVSQVMSAAAFSNNNIEWLFKNVHSFDSPLPSSNEKRLQVEDLTFFKKAIGSSKIVALGESTHGTSEFFSLKHKLLQYAVTVLGFRVFALEDHFIVGEEINAYLTQGIGTMAQATRGLFGTWNRVEVYKMIQWIRDYNIEHPNDMVYFVGLDIQEVTKPIDSVLQFIQQQDVRIYRRYASVLKALKKKGQYPFLETDSLVKLDWIKKSEEIYAAICSKKETWLGLAKTDKEKRKIAYGVQYANIVQQYFKEVLHNGGDLYRDEAMAINMSWYLENVYPKAKVILWAHDSHVSRGEHKGIFTNFNNGISMGAFLSKKYGSNYKSFGLATYNGHFLAFKTYDYKTLVNAPLFPSPVGSLEEALHQVSLKTNSNNLFLALPRTIDWLNKPLPLRFANHVNIDYGYWGRLVVPYQFDGLFFIDKTSSAKKPH